LNARSVTTPWAPAPVAPRRGNPERTGPGGSGGPSFADVLAGELPAAATVRPASIPINFSMHARDRLAVKGIRLEDSQLSRLAGAVDRAAVKGARDSLVILDDLALVVNVKNRTVVTAVTGDRMREGVFTQIDSAVIV
jgi:flagellar operon protein